MNIVLKSCFATIAVASAFAAAGVHAATEAYINDANAPARCQAFAPGPTNTVRNRVTGSENIGAAMNVACAFENIGSFDYASQVVSAGVQIANNGTAAFAVSCSELSGYFGDAGTVLNKTSASVAPGQSQYVDFDANDTPDTADTDLGSYAVGIVCNLPTHAVMGETYSVWYDEDGIEAP